MTEPVKLNLDEEKIKAWLLKGARPSDTARAFLIGRGLLPKESAKKRPTKPTKAESAAAAAKAGASEAGAPTPAAPATEGAYRRTTTPTSRATSARRWVRSRSA